MGFFYPQWQKIIRIEVTTPPTTTGYQVMVEIPWQPGMRDDFADLRFSDYARTLPYWIETFTTRVTATVWIKLTEINEASREFFCYFGNGGAVSESSGANTFLKWADGTSLAGFDYCNTATYRTTNGYIEHYAPHFMDMCLWNMGSLTEYIIDGQVREHTRPTGAAYCGFAGKRPLDNSNTSNCVLFSFGDVTNGGYEYMLYNAGWAGVGVVASQTVDTWYAFKFVISGNTLGIGYADINATHATTYRTQRDATLSSGVAAGIYSYGDSGQGYRNVRIRSYQSTEPTCTPVESGINTAWYIGVLRAKHVLHITLTAVQHLTHIDLTWTE